MRALHESGGYSLWSLLGFAVLGAMIADYGWYLAGRRYGGKLLALLCKISLSPDSAVFLGFLFSSVVDELLNVLLSLALGETTLNLITDGEVIVYCYCPNEVSAALVSKRLLQSGDIRVRPMLGGMEAWRATGFDIQRDPDQFEAAL